MNVSTFCFIKNYKIYTNSILELQVNNMSVERASHENIFKNQIHLLKL
tara:strand:+ start:104 stop:247 length:144 start_codon:yes stop_codon:yes gene_type:complete